MVKLNNEELSFIYEVISTSLYNDNIEAIASYYKDGNEVMGLLPIEELSNIEATVDNVENFLDDEDMAEICFASFILDILSYEEIDSIKKYIDYTCNAMDILTSAIRLSDDIDNIIANAIVEVIDLAR